MNTQYEFLLKQPPGTTFAVRAYNLELSAEAFDALASSWELGMDGFEVVNKPHRENHSGKRHIDLIWLRRDCSQ